MRVPEHHGLLTPQQISLRGLEKRALCSVRTQGRREVSSPPGESAKASWKKWLNWVLKDWWCFPHRNGVGVQESLVPGRWGLCQARNLGGFIVSEEPGQVQWGWSWCMTLSFCPALLQRTREEQALGRHPTASRLLWGQEGMRGEGAPLLMAQKQTSDHESKLWGGKFRLNG